MVNGRCRFIPAPLGNITRIVTKDDAKIQNNSLSPNKNDEKRERRTQETNQEMGVVCKTHQIVIMQKPKGMGGKMKEDIINLSNTGLAVEEIAEELECDEGCVFAVLEEAGIL